MKKRTSIKVRLEKETVRQLTERDYRAVIGGSSIVYTCAVTESGTQTGQTVVGCPA
jgi:hypothetical protein